MYSYSEHRVAFKHRQDKVACFVVISLNLDIDLFVYFLDKDRQSLTLAWFNIYNTAVYSEQPST